MKFWESLPRFDARGTRVRGVCEVPERPVLATIVIRLKLHRKMRNRSYLIGYPERGRNWG
jgi:hypothetical protein